MRRVRVRSGARQDVLVEARDVPTHKVRARSDDIHSPAGVELRDVRHGRVLRRRCWSFSIQTDPAQRRCVD